MASEKRGIQHGIKWSVIDRLIEAHPTWSHTNIAKKLGFSAGYWSELRRGKERVTWPVILCLAAFFDLEYNSFLSNPSELLGRYPVRDRLNLRESQKLDTEEESRTQYRMLCHRLYRRKAKPPTYEEFRQRQLNKITYNYSRSAK